MLINNPDFLPGYFFYWGFMPILLVKPDCLSNDSSI